MSRNTPVIIECDNCGRDVRDGTVGNRLNRKLCDTCRRAYNQALDDYITEIESQTTFYCGKDSHLRQILEQLKR